MENPDKSIKGNTKYHPTSRTSLMSTPLTQYLKSNFGTIEDTYKIKVLGATFTINNVEEWTKENAWIQVKQNETKIIESLSKQNDILFVLSTIEIHPGKKKKESKKITQKKEKMVKQLTQISKLMDIPKPVLDQHIENEGLGVPKDESDGEEKDEFDKVTLEGYPHIHIAIGMTTYTGKYRTKESLLKILYDTDTYGDIVIGSNKKFGRGGDRTGNWDDPVFCLKYIYKNSKHDPVHNILQAVSGNGNCISYYGLQGIKEIDDFFKNIKKPHDHPTNYHYKQANTELQKLTIKDVGVGDGFQKLVNRIIALMEEKDVIHYKRAIYKKAVGSKQTYEIWFTPNEFYNHIKPKGEYLTLWKDHKTSVISILESDIQPLFPTKKLTPFWRECKDCFFDVEECKVVYNCPYNCMVYHGDVTADDILNMKCDPELFRGILKNSGLDIPEFHKDCYKLFCKHKPKEPNMCLKGTPDSGRTTLMETILSNIPKSLIITPVNGDFSEETLPDKHILFADEGDEVDTWKPSKLKKYAEGDWFKTIKRKHRSSIEAILNFHFILCVNHDIFGFEKKKHMIFDEIFGTYFLEPEYEKTLILKNDVDTLAMQTRYNYYTFQKLPNADKSMKLKVKAEKSKVFFYLSYAYKKPTEDKDTKFDKDQEEEFMVLD